MNHRVPFLAVLLTAAGLVPFILAGLWAISSPRIPNDTHGAAGVQALVGYGAVVLAFIGAIHWGISFSIENDPLHRTRLTSGVVPSLIGWLALIMSLYTYYAVALSILIAGFIATVVVEGRASRRGWVPQGYMAMRWVTTLLVVAILSTVLVLRVVGGRVLL